MRDRTFLFWPKSHQFDVATRRKQERDRSLNVFFFKKKVEKMLGFFVCFWKHLAGFFTVPELDLKLRERLRLVVLGLIGAKSCAIMKHSSLGHIFEPLMCWQGGGPHWRKCQNFGFFFLVWSLWKGPWWLLLIEKLFVFVYCDVWKGLMLIEVDFGQLPFDTFSTDQPWDHFALSRYNDWK